MKPRAEFDVLIQTEVRNLAQKCHALRINLKRERAQVGHPCIIPPTHASTASHPHTPLQPPTHARQHTACSDSLPHSLPQRTSLRHRLIVDLQLEIDLHGDRASPTGPRTCSRRPPVT